MHSPANLLAVKTTHIPGPLILRASIAHLRAVGIYHGPSFQNLFHMQANKGQSISTFQIAETPSIMPTKVEQPHVIHPTTLDSIFLSTYSVLPNANFKHSTAMIPRYIKGMFVSNDISSRPEHRYNTQTTLQSYHPHGFKTSVFIGRTDDAPILAINELYCRSLEDISEHDDESHCMNKALAVNWAPHVNLNPPSFFMDASKPAPVDSKRIIVTELRQACYHLNS